MIIYRAYRYELDPNNSQRTLLHKHTGVARFIYNWGLESRIRLYKENQGKDRFTNFFEQSRELTTLKKTRCPWLYETSVKAQQEALRDLDSAFRNFYRGLKTGKRIGFPRFKKKGKHDSFRLKGIIRFIGKMIQLPKFGRIKLKEKKDQYSEGKILSATVTKKANRWFVSVNVEMIIATPKPVEGRPVGVDLGVRTLATLSDGTTFKNRRSLERRLKKMKKLSKSLSRKKKGSRNREKAKLSLAKLYLRVFNIRQDTLHKITTFLAKNHSRIVIEDLCVSGMLKNKKISRAIADVGFYEFRRQLEYKCGWYGSELVIAPRFYPSSKRCSSCGHVKSNIELSERIYICKNCSLEINRDLNAAINLVAASWTETRNACGEDIRLNSEQTSLNQEPNISHGF
jgi:putative transposase